MEEGMSLVCAGEYSIPCNLLSKIVFWYFKDEEVVYYITGDLDGGKKKKKKKKAWATKKKIKHRVHLSLYIFLASKNKVTHS